MTNIYKFDPDDARRFGREHGMQFRQRGDELQFVKCPYCGWTSRDKDTFSINLRTGQFKCLRASCGAHGNMLTLARDFGFSLGRDADEYYSRKRRYKDLSNHPRPITKAPAVEYMEGRGISKEVTERYAITTQKEHDNILVFPFYDENKELQFAKYRKTDFDKEKDKNKEWCEANCKPILFGMDQCDPEKSKTLILTEGQIDSLSVTEAWIDNAVSVPTGANGFTWVPYCWDFLEKFETLIVFGDHEKGKITLLEEMSVRFHGTVKHVRPEDYQGCKDANELLRARGKAAVLEAVKNAVPVENKHIKALEDVRRVNLSELEKFKTCIPKLDRVLGGLYMGQLVILTGKRGEGKSTFASQIATRAIQSGYNVFFYSGELMDWYFRAWFDQQVAGPKYINTKQTAGEDPSYSVMAECYPYIESWYSGKMFIYDSDIVKNADADETEILLETARDAIVHYGCRALFFDNLMTAIDDDIQSDLYRQQTKFVKDLAIMAKQHNVLVVLIVHPRKSGASEMDNDDVAGSSNITNLADVVLRYGRPKATNSEPNPPAGRLQVWKNRLTGRTEKEINLNFDEKSRRITEKTYPPQNVTWRLGWEEEYISDSKRSIFDWNQNEADEDENILFD